jgi:hypothetical protein
LKRIGQNIADYIFITKSLIRLLSENIKQMNKLTIFAGILVLTFSFALPVRTNAQNRKSVGETEVNGTFRYYFNGKFKGSYNEIRILALGKGRLRISFDLLYPYVTGSGELSANMGSAEGTAEIVGDTAVYTSEEFDNCSITIKFVRPGTIKVSQEGNDSDCGFGHNVNADGVYRKASNSKPKF